MTVQLGTVTVLGTGVLGSRIAYQSAYCGYPVTAYDVNDAALGVGRERITGLAERHEREVDAAAGIAALRRLRDDDARRSLLPRVGVVARELLPV